MTALASVLNHRMNFAAEALGNEIRLGVGTQVK